MIETIELNREDLMNISYVITKLRKEGIITVETFYEVKEKIDKLLSQNDGSYAAPLGRRSEADSA